MTEDENKGLREKDCVKISYNAYVEEDDELFDTMSEEKAREAGIYQEDEEYKPVKTIIGAGFLIPGLDESLKGKEAGSEYEVTIPPSKGFGEWDSDNTENIKYSNFKDKDFAPRKGMILNVGGRMGRVSFVSKGRFVKMDFNHPLAGKELKYEVKVLSKIEDEEEKLRIIIGLLLGKEGVEVEVEEEKATITTATEVPENLQKLVKSKIKETLKKEYDLKFKYEKD